MLDFDAGKLLIVGLVALVFIPTKDLPRVLRQAGQFVGKMRRMAADFQGQFMDAMREADMADVRKEAQKLADAARVDTSFGSIDDHNRDVMRSLEAKETATVTPSAPASETVKPNDEGAAFAALQNELRPLVEKDEAKASDDSRVPHSV